MNRLALLIPFAIVGCASTIEPCPPAEIDGIYDVSCTIAGVYDTGNMEMWDQAHTLEVSSGHLLFPRPSCRTPLIVAGNEFVSGDSEPCVVDPYRTDTMRSVTGTISCMGDLVIELEQDVTMRNDPDVIHIERTWVCRGHRR